MSIAVIYSDEKGCQRITVRDVEGDVTSYSLEGRDYVELPGVPAGMLRAALASPGQWVNQPAPARRWYGYWTWWLFWGVVASAVAEFLYLSWITYRLAYRHDRLEPWVANVTLVVGLAFIFTTQLLLGGGEAPDDHKRRAEASKRRGGTQ